MFWLLVITVLFIGQRLPHLGHILAWDEAWNLVALQSITRGDTLLSEQFWRHPPVYMAVGLLLNPLESGLDIRMEILSLVINAGALLVFVMMAASILGRRTAVYSGLAATFLPGTIFFDSWVKRDPAVTFFCILALWAYIKHREWLAGILLGLGLLSKETALFYCGALVLITIFWHPGKKSWPKLTKVFAIALLLAGWWYVLMFSKRGLEHLGFFQGYIVGDPDFIQPWWYYLAQIPSYTGYPGFLLLCIGLLTLLPRGRHSLKTVPFISRQLKRKRMLPLYLLLPGHLLLAFSSGKPPWLTISLYPALAILMGFGWSWAVNLLGSILKKITRNSLAIIPHYGTIILLTILVGIPVANFQYETFFQKISPGQYTLHQLSFEAASLVNDHVKNDEKLMLLPFLFQSNPEWTNPIFQYYLLTDPEVFRITQPLQNYQVFKEIITRKKMDWVLMTPTIGSAQEDFLINLIYQTNFQRYPFSRGVLVRVNPLGENTPKP